MRSKGTMYFVLHPHGISMSGRWVGLSYDGKVVTGAGRRTLPLSAPVVQALRAHPELQDHERAEAVVWEDRDLVLCTRAGRPLSQRNAHRSWTRILASAGVEHRGIHHMRHAYVTMLAESGVHERVTQQLAGHADSRVTREVYTHVTGSMLDGATAAIERAAEDLYGPGASGMGPELGPRAPRKGEGDGSEVGRSGG